MNKQTKQLVKDALIEYRVYLAARDRREPHALNIAKWALPTVRRAVQALSPYPITGDSNTLHYALELLEESIAQGVAL